MAVYENFEDFREMLWGSQDGRKTPIKDLDIGHLVNILNWVKARPTAYPGELYPMLVQEANYRKMMQFVAGDQIPRLGEDGLWYLTDSTTGDLVTPQSKTDYDSVDKS